MQRNKIEDDEEECENHAPFLPPLADEMNLRILGYLSPHELARVAKVCQDGRRLVADPSLWRPFLAGFETTYKTELATGKTIYGAMVQFSKEEKSKTLSKIAKRSIEAAKLILQTPLLVSKLNSEDIVVRLLKSTMALLN